jgi:hypothetical protein
VIATECSLWLQNKSMYNVFANYFVYVIVSNTTGYFVIAKKTWTVCDCNYFVCAFATGSYLWLQHDCVCVVKAACLFWLFMIARLSSVWLQQQIRCDCKKTWTICLCNYFVCVVANTVMLILWLQKKDWTVCVYNYFLCVSATRSYLWLQHDCVCVVKVA